MTFEETLRDRIKKAAFGSKERDLIKVVLGAVQQKAAGGKMTDEQGLAIVKAMVGTNNKMLYGDETEDPPVKPLFADGDARRLPIEEENVILKTLLPTYLTADQIEASLAQADLVEQIKTAKGEGPATGIAVKHFKANNVPVEGETVKAVVQKLRA
jgi:hypothetical protein